jgi:hypothetical protein
MESSSESQTAGNEHSPRHGFGRKTLGIGHSIFSSQSLKARKKCKVRKRGRQNEEDPVCCIVQLIGDACVMAACFCVSFELSSIFYIVSKDCDLTVVEFKDCHYYAYHSDTVAILMFGPCLLLSRKVMYKLSEVASSRLANIVVVFSFAGIIALLMRDGFNIVNVSHRYFVDVCYSIASAVVCLSFLCYSAKQNSRILTVYMDLVESQKRRNITGRASLRGNLSLLSALLSGVSECSLVFRMIIHAYRSDKPEILTPVSSVLVFEVMREQIFSIVSSRSEAISMEAMSSRIADYSKKKVVVIKDDCLDD